MNRQRRYRLWDGKKMHLPEYSDWEDFFIMPDGSVCKMEETGVYECFRNLVYLPNVIVMDFTGLQDKNKKEVYEGDIVKYHDHPTGIEDGIGSVYWKDGKWMVTWSMIPLGDFGTAWIEVIGNIYENPELLKQ